MYRRVEELDGREEEMFGRENEIFGRKEEELYGRQEMYQPNRRKAGLQIRIH